ncbi:MAG TPA: sigma-54 dependent transcriptional regulator [Rectinemataceae bacterium]|nr:sigma-54 dependent transcriptional regulator [Rectinemataceae bacterium]
MSETARPPILVVDDDPDVLKRMERLLRFEGFPDVILCDDPRSVSLIVSEREISAMVLDLLMPLLPGQRILQETRERHPEIPVIVATAVSDLDSAIECMRNGAFDYVPKTAESGRLVASIRHALSIRELQSDYSALKNTLLSAKRPESPAFAKIVTRDERMLSVLRYVETVAASPKPILVIGESGTGKELVAEAVHILSGRKGKLVSLNIAGLDDTMFSDSLFGHRRGAFTGADADRGGLIERAEGGTLFLDEIGDLSFGSQVKLLRLIDDRRYYPLGSDLPKASNAAVVTATNKNLRGASASGAFRLDLFYRLQTHLVELPPLRERLGDLPLLLEHFARSAAERLERRTAPLVPDELVILLESYDFPGNVRELESMVYDAVSRSKGNTLSLESFRDKIRSTGREQGARRVSVDDRTRFSSWERLPTIREASDELIREALRRAKGNQGIAADLLGLSRTALNKRLKSSGGADGKGDAAEDIEGLGV